MSLRYYKLQINDIKTNKPILEIDSDTQPFQIKTSVTYTNVATMNEYVLIEVYNLNIPKVSTDFLNAKITLIAGSKDSSVTKLQGIRSSQIAPNLIVNGYIYDATFDFTEMPNQKVIFKVSTIVNHFVPSKVAKQNIKDLVGSSYLTNTVTVGPVYGNGKNPYKPLKSNLILTKGSDIINFCKRTVKLYTGQELINLTGQQKMPNDFDDISYYFDPRRSNIIATLNLFLKKLTETGSSIYAYPLAIIGTLNGYALSYDFKRFTRDQIKKYIEDNKLVYKVSGSDSYNAQLNKNIITYANAKEKIESYNLQNNMLISPPIRVSSDTVQVQCMLLPSIKPGDFIIIGNLGAINADGTTDRYSPAITSNIGGTIDSVLSKYNGVSGTFLVNEVSHNLNFSESSPTSWTTVLNLIQFPHSKEVTEDMLYKKQS